MLQQAFGFSLPPRSSQGLAPIPEGLRPSFQRPLWAPERLALHLCPDRAVRPLEELAPPPAWTVRQPWPLCALSAVVGVWPLLLSRPSRPFPDSRPLALARIRVPPAPPHTGSRIRRPALSRKNPSPYRSVGCASRSARPCNDATPAALRTRAPHRNIRKT